MPLLLLLPLLPLLLPLLPLPLLAELLPVPPPHADAAPPSRKVEPLTQPKLVPGATAVKSTTLPQTMSGRQQPGKVTIWPMAEIV